MSNSSKKIAIDVRSIGCKRTGDEVYTLNLIRSLALIDQINQYYLCVDSLENEINVKKNLGVLPKNFSVHLVQPSSKLLWTQYALPSFIKKNQIDLVHVQYISPLFLPKKTKLITTIHDISFARFPEYIKRKDRWALNFLIPKSINKADRIITVSQFSANELFNFYKNKDLEKKIRVVYNGIDHSSFLGKVEVSNDLKEKIRDKYNLKKRFIFHLSSLQPRKNVPFLIKTFQKYIHQKKDEETILLIGGEKSHNYDERIDEIMQDLLLKQRVKMLGHIDKKELPIFYSLAHLYTSLSFYEGFNLPLIEAMQSETPVLASHYSCHSEIINGAGLLVNPEKEDELLNSFTMGLNNALLRKELVFKGKERAKNFSWQKCAEDTLRVYQEVLS